MNLVFHSTNGNPPPQIPKPSEGESGCFSPSTVTPLGGRFTALDGTGCKANRRPHPEDTSPPPTPRILSFGVLPSPWARDHRRQCQAGAEAAQGVSLPVPVPTTCPQREESRFYICFKGLGTLKSQSPEASRAEAGPFYSHWKKLKAEVMQARTYRKSTTEPRLGLRLLPPSLDSSPRDQCWSPLESLG